MPILAFQNMKILSCHLLWRRSFNYFTNMWVSSFYQILTVDFFKFDCGYKIAKQKNINYYYRFENKKLLTYNYFLCIMLVSDTNTI